MENIKDKVRELYAFEDELYHYNLDENGYLAKLTEMVNNGNILLMSQI